MALGLELENLKKMGNGITQNLLQEMVKGVFSALKLSMTFIFCSFNPNSDVYFTLVSSLITGGIEGLGHLNTKYKIVKTLTTI